MRAQIFNRLQMTRLFSVITSHIVGGPNSNWRGGGRGQNPPRVPKSDRISMSGKNFHPPAFFNMQIYKMITKFSGVTAAGRESSSHRANRMRL